ncbi:MAG: acyltransferase [Bryobacterales bacterium]|nr:acyltransferase [Bryobacterales bacterium]
MTNKLSTAPIISAEKPSPATSAFAREYGLDWLRVFAFSILILYHTGMIFVSWPFHIKNAETSETLEWLMLLVNRWRLPLLFLVAGAAVCFSLRRRTYGQFVGERTRRLFLPLVFGMFVIIPPQIYFERLYQGSTLSYAAWYPSVFEFQSYPQGSLSWHHLWFVLYIFVYSLVGIPFFRWVRSPAGQHAVNRLVDVFERAPATLYLVNVPNIIVGMSLGPFWPTTHNLVADWANLTGSLLTFLWGFTIASNPRFLDHITRRRNELAIAGIVIAALFFTLRATGALSGLPGVPRMVAWNLISAYFGFAWVMALVGLARHHIRQGGPKLRYATEAVYPFYIFHQTIMIAVGYYVIQWNWGVWPKFAVVAFATFLGSWIAVELVRRTALTRLLFGLKP